MAVSNTARSEKATDHLIQCRLVDLVDGLMSWFSAIAIPEIARTRRANHR